MRTIFTTDGIGPQSSFRVWRETISERIRLVEQSRIDDRPFLGRIESADVASLPITRVVQGALRTEVTSNTIRRDPKADGVSVIVKLHGRSTVGHLDRVSTQKPGDIVLIDRSKPALLSSDHGSSSFILEVSRERMEEEFGRVGLFAGINIEGRQPSAALARGFFENLARLHGALDAATAERMASIGVDLLVATVAERLSREASGPVRDTLTVQRAKAYVRAHLGRTMLDPHEVAAAVGVSTRRLYELFQERGQGIAEWIWERRCDEAARLMRDPGCTHLQIGEIARRCGFLTHPHFSQRFRERFGMTPREYRAASFPSGT